LAGRPDIAGGEVGEQRILARPAVAVTGIALRLASEEVVPGIFSCSRELCLPASTASNFEVKDVTSAEASYPAMDCAI
jgi:hypothetical protein